MIFVCVYVRLFARQIAEIVTVRDWRLGLHNLVGALRRRPT